jgi:hypothetical protein
MDAELLVQRIANKISPEPIRQIFEKQVLAKVLTPASLISVLDRTVCRDTATRLER